MSTDPNSRPKKNNEKRNFYIALSVCLLAAAAAAWSTYASVMDYVKTNRTQPAAVSSLISGEETVSSAAPSSGEEGAAPPVSSAEEAPGSSAPAAVESEEAVEAAAYTESDRFLSPGGEVLAAYSGNVLVYNETMRDWRTHPGCDVACNENGDVLACANGVVVQTYTDALWGNVIEVEHGSYTLRYCGVGENFMVKAGDVLRQGQVIASATAVPCEATQERHIHLEAEKDGVPVDPAALFAQ